jgi:hypothetical protein
MSVIKWMMTGLGLWVATLNGGHAATAEPVDSETTDVVTSEEPQRSWQAGVSADYFTDLEQANPVSSFGLNVSSAAGEGTAFVSQSLSKRYYIYEDQPEFGLSDAVLGYSQAIPARIKGMSFSASLSATLPTSDYSQRHDVYSKPQIGLSAAESFLSERLSFQYGIYLKGYISRYTSEASGDGIGGRPLPKFAYGASQSGQYQILQKLTGSYSLGYNEIYYYTLEPNATEALSVVNLPDQTYNVSMSLGWSFDRHLQTSLGFSQGSQLLHAGTTDLVLFDEDVSQVFMAANYQY